MAVLILFTSFIRLNAQVTFEKTFDISGDDVANDVRQTSDGGFIICGSVDYSAMSSGDVILIRTNANGDTLWTKIYGGIGADAGNSVLQTSDGDLLLPAAPTAGEPVPRMPISLKQMPPVMYNGAKQSVHLPVMLLMVLFKKQMVAMFFRL